MSGLQDHVDASQIRYMQVTLSKARYLRRIPRQTVADAVGVPVSYVSAFDDGKLPVETITLSFLQKYARAVDMHLLMLVTDWYWDSPRGEM